MIRNLKTFHGNRSGFLGLLALFLFACAVLAAGPAKSATACNNSNPNKTIVAAYFFVTADDQADFYINGNHLGTTPGFAYANVFTYPVPIGWLNSGGNNNIAVTKFDMQPSAGGISYLLYIVYSDGTVAESTSNPSTTTIYTYNDGASPSPVYSPPVLGLQWYQPGYPVSTQPGWTTPPYNVTGCYGGWATITDPLTGGTVPWIDHYTCGAETSGLPADSYVQAATLCNFLTPTPTDTPTKTWTPVPCAFSLRVNTGGTGYIDGNGNGWAPDQAYNGVWGYTGGTATNTGNAIFGTGDQPLYQNQRYSATYQFTLPNGTYQVTMKFAETNPTVTAAGQHVFTVLANGTPVISNLDLIAAAGSDVAYDRTFIVTVSGGTLTLSGTASAGLPTWGGIQILGQLGSSCTPTPTWTPTPTGTPTNTLTPTVPMSATPTNTQVQTYTPVPPTPTWTPVNCAFIQRVNAGGPSYIDGNGNAWAADQPYTGPGGWGYWGGSGTFSTGAAILGTTDATLYQTWRQAAVLQYIFTVPATGNYLVTLKYAENFFTIQGSRVFSVAINGTSVLTNLDLDFYGKNVAKDFSFTVSGASGAITIVETASRDQAIVNAIQVQGLTAAGACTPTPTWTSTPTITPTPTLPPPTLTMTPPPCSFSQRVVMGSTVPITDKNGNVWAADQLYTAGGFGYATTIYSTYCPGPTSIINTTDPALYQCMRNGNPDLTYYFTVPNGTYRVTMLLAELYFATGGNRVFSIQAQGTTFVSNLDLAGTYGKAVAVDPSVVVTVSSGVLTITGFASVNVPVFSGIYVQGLGSSCTPTNTPTNSPTSTPTRTPTSTPTFTPTFTVTNSPTNTPTGTSTYTPTNTPTRTATGTPTNSPTNTPTGTPTNTTLNTPTNTATNTATLTATNTLTNTATNTATQTPTASTTATPTSSPTLTATSSASPTPTNTPVFTFTPTSTPTTTGTNTATGTPTNTPTNTPANTYTNTATNSPTSTPTYTPTNTGTPTATFTPTSTATPTSTNTLANTATNTATNTSTSTFTFTATNTPTSTLTNTATSTPTSTPTNTPTNTATPTPSFTSTNTATKTATPTPTNSPTVTFTFTATSTPTTGVSLQKQASVTMVQGGSTFTYTLSLSITNSGVSGVTLTDVLPSNEGFVAFGTSPAGTVPSQNGQNLQWLMPPLPPGNYTVSYSVKAADFLAGGTVLTNSAQLTAANLPTQTASASVTAMASFTVKVGVYNEAGELVKKILLQQFSQPINGFNLQSSNQITSLQGPNHAVSIYYGGYLLGSWNGSNQSGDPVSNGAYYVKIDNMDPTGVVTDVSERVTVSRSLARVNVEIFNEAGEVVRHLYSLVDDPNGASMTNVILSSSVLEPYATASPGLPYQVQIALLSSGQPVTLVWDGKNDSGQVVTSGHYVIGVHWDNGQGAQADISRGILVGDAGNRSGGVAAAPNILTVSTGVDSTTFIAVDPAVKALSASIYTVAGELVRKITGIPGTTQTTWNASRVASGIYIAVVESFDGNGFFLSRQTLKILVVK